MTCLSRTCAISSSESFLAAAVSYELVATTESMNTSSVPESMNARLSRSTPRSRALPRACLPAGANGTAALSVRWRSISFTVEVNAEKSAVISAESTA